MYYLLFVARIIEGLEDKECMALDCSSGPTRDKCIEIQDEKILISPCVDSFFCKKNQFDDAIAWKNTTCIKDESATTLCNVTEGSLFTGRKCCVSPNCYSKQCTNDRCEGTSEGEECIYDEECYPGYFCTEKKNSNKKVCTATGTEICSQDNECPIGYGCNNGFCMQFHTVDVARFVERDIFCKTNFSYEGRCDYIKAFSNNEEIFEDTLFQCDIGLDCTYYTAIEHIIFNESLCLCAGIQDSEIGYCGQFAEKSQNVSIYFDALVYDDSYCTGYYSHTDDYEILYECGSISYEKYEYAKSMISRYNYYNLYASHALDHCARPLGLFDPWYSETSFSYLVYMTTYFLLL